jgi:two-component system, chemotaxis family, chemotaxis protein CheY
MPRILVVDDSNLSRRTTRRILEGAGYEVIEAADGFAALEHYALERPDATLLDVTMAEMNGLEVLQRMRAMDEEARVVIATADVQSSTRELAMAYGATGYVTKPFSKDRVLDAIADAVKGATP